jgi:hypothetical protein
MFSTKQTCLLEKQSIKSKSSKNSFLNGLQKESAKTLSGNGALKFSDSGSEWVNQFTKLGTFKTPRKYEDIVNDCEVLWGLDKELCVKFILYIRMISRKTDLVFLNVKTNEAQSGAELKHEGIMRMVWLSQKAPEVFWENVGLFISAGSCKDILTMLRYDLMYHGWDNRVLNWNKFETLIKSLLENTITVNLMKKYLPQIKPNGKCTTLESQANNIIAKWICSSIFGSKNGGSTYKQYRKLKTSGTAHEWQKLISQQKFDRLDFGKIHGRALNLLVKSKFLKNHNLQDVYSKWIGEQKTVKYTGFVHELLCDLDMNRDPNFEKTVDKQFLELVEKVKNGEENFTKLIVVRDTSHSMSATATGTKYSCYNIGKALALYFSEFLSGEFANHWIEFNSDAKLHQWKGSGAVSKWRSDSSHYVGSTNFQSVIKLFCKMKNQGVSEQDFPQGILCISDSEFNPTSLGKTNIDTALYTLKSAGFSQDYLNNFKIILWNLQSSYYGSGTGCKFETFGDVKNVFYMSGYSASNVKFLLNQKVETAEDLFNTAMDQELLALVKV